MEFTYNENRFYKKTILAIKLFFLSYHFLCVYIDIRNIEKNYNFIYYLIAIFTKFLSICNNIRYEIAFSKIMGKTFNTVGDFLLWKKNNELFKFTMVLNSLEMTSHILFFIVTSGYRYSIEPDYISYSLSCIILNINAILYMVFVLFIFIFFCLLYIPSHYKSIINTNSVYNINLSITEKIDINKECCICFDKNTNPWIDLNCKHDFHQICLNEWLKQKRTCPICRDII